MEGRRAIVLITDGYDEHSQAAFDEALTAVKSVQATVYVVGVGGVAGISLKGERLLRRLTEETGGRMFLPSREEELSAVNTTLASDVQNRYLISYTPSNQNADGTWRRISVDTGDPTHRVRARAGYFAPKPPPVRPSIEFTVTRGDGEFVDVEVGDLQVHEDGVLQTVDTFQEAVAPVSIVLAMDASGSMKPAADMATAAATRFVSALRAQDALGLVMFSDASEVLMAPATDRQRMTLSVRTGRREARRSTTGSLMRSTSCEESTAGARSSS